ncbi:MAG TPA: prepilin-type N-terminal cleavage/methylation domain-containing protein [Planctomycetota bacterium]|nr:prepilin-type N-terminal cleavage/methylation domain-containing protein [Planctomycetota bacterium]
MRTRGARGGFTLVELLVVMAILATLVGLGVATIPAMMRRADKTAVEGFLSMLDAQIENYRNSEQGAYPPSTLAEFPGVGLLSNFENSGIEALVACLASRAYRPSFDLLERQKKMRLENYDGDRTAVQLTDFGDKDLFEIVDPWGTPLVYIHSSDYGRAEEICRVTGEAGVLKAKPWMNPQLKRAYMPDRYQLISAGPDREFNTEDDVTNFERN